jgi:hypothetical protein
MPRRIPRIDLLLSSKAQEANEIVLAGERAHTRGGPTGAEWTTKRLEFLHELAYLRLFAAWEDALEAIFLRSLCGFHSSAGAETLAIGRFHKTIADAQAAVLAAESRGAVLKTFLLWHSPAQLLRRFRAHIAERSPGMGGIQEQVISSSQARLEALASVRHRIVHEQGDAKSKFDAATLLLAARTYPASRPGKFLRDVDTSAVPPRKWLDAAIAELVGLAGQMV